MDSITSADINRQAGAYYLVLFFWCLYLLLLPGAYALWGWPGLLLIFFPGLYFFTWMGYLMHEAWHKYVPMVPNKFFYQMFAYLLLTDPQIYHLLHGHHHSEVNTYDDREFHPLGKIESRAWRRIYHFFEITLGVGFVMTMSLIAVPRHPRYAQKYKLGKTLVTVMVTAALFIGFGWLSQLLFNVTAGQILIPYLMTYALGSMLLHHSQLVEHGNLIMEGDWQQRNIKTRNLRARTWLEKLFLFMTHHDAQEHVLHHTQTRIYCRPFPGRVPLPPEAVFISLRDYAGILGDMFLGRDSTR